MEHDEAPSGSSGYSHQDQYQQRAEMAANQLLLNNMDRRRGGHIQLDMEMSDNNDNDFGNFNEGSSDQQTAEGAPTQSARVQEAADRLRTEYTRLTQTINQNEDAQTICTIFTSLLPFVALFAMKAVIDHLGALVRIVLGVSIFFWYDSRIQSLVSSGSSLLERVALSLFCLVFIYVTSNSIYPVEDFNLPKTLTLQYTGDTFHGFFFSLYLILLTDVFVKLVTCFLKLVVAMVPSTMLSAYQKRRTYQCLEYLSQLYRCVLPVTPWIYYFYGPEDEAHLSSYALIGMFLILKVREVTMLFKLFMECLSQLFTLSNYGSTPTREEIEEAQICSICHDRLHTSTTKLACSHVFCMTCIDTWLDKEHTCPMCRAVVEKKNNLFKSGSTSKFFRFY